MSKPSKLLPSIIMPQCPRWFALAVMAALAAVAVWQLTWGGLAVFVFSWLAVFAAFPILVGVLQPGPRHINRIVLACVVLVVLTVTVTAALVAIASPTLIGSASSLLGASGQPVRSE